MPKKYDIVILSKTSFLIIIFFIFSLLVTIVLFLAILYNSSSSEVIGTYCSGNELSANTLYLTIEENGSYVLYKQFHVISSGQYRSENKTIYLLQSKNSSLQYLFYDGKNEVSFCSIDNGVLSFQRISNVPMYININPVYKF